MDQVHTYDIETMGFTVSSFFIPFRMISNLIFTERISQLHHLMEVFIYTKHLLSL